MRDVFFYIGTVMIKIFFSTGSIVRMEINEKRKALRKIKYVFCSTQKAAVKIKAVIVLAFVFEFI